MNFGKGIVLALAFFMSFIGYLAYQSFQQKIDLVADNYYEQEVQFQQQIDKAQNTVNLGENPVIKSLNSDQQITFPKQQLAKDITGKIIFFRASDNTLDFEVIINLNERGEQVISRDKFIKGKYKAKLEWTYQGKMFYYEENIII